MTTQGLFLNEDSNHFAYSRSADEMTPEGVDGLVDSYANGTQVTDLLFNVNGQKSSIASGIRQTFWEGYSPDIRDDDPFFGDSSYPKEVIRKWVGNMLLLEQRGIDPYARWLARCKKYGVRGWISLRTNDIHCVNEPGNMMHDAIWREHPEYWRVTWREFESGHDRTLNWAEPAVRKYNLDYAKEVIARYDMDGLEIDWLRDIWCFRSGEEQVDIMTDFTAEIRRMLDARAKQVGLPIRLCARVPSRAEVARKMGYDTVTWARQNLVDVIVPTPGFGNNDFDMPIEEWKNLLHGTGVTLAPALENFRAAHPFAAYEYVSQQEVRGLAASFLDRGADQIYLYNFMDRDPTSQRVSGSPHTLREVGRLGTLVGKARSHVLTYANLWAPGDAPAFPLPYRISRFGYRPSAEFRVPIGPEPLPTQEATIRIGFEIADAPTDQGQYITAYGRRFHFGLPAIASSLAKQIVVRVHGQVCSFVGDVARAEATGPTHVFRVPAGALHRGDNVIEVSNMTETTATIVWIDISISDAK